MMMRNALAILFLMMFGKISAQVHEALVSDTTIVMMHVFDNDTSFALKTQYREGEWMVYFDSAHKRKAFYIKYIQYSYISTAWYENGQIKSEVLAGGPDPECINVNKWYRDGKVKAVYKCYTDSCVMIDYYFNGQIANKSIETPDSLHANYFLWHYCAEYYENGQLKYDPYDPNGPRKTVMNYYPSGAKKIQNDVWGAAGRVGPFKEWYENGQLKIEGNYESGIGSLNPLTFRMTGKWSYYDESGKLTKEEFYDNNILTKTITY